MTFFEITNDYVGVTYVRVYAWAETEAQALGMARQAFRTQHLSPGYSWNLTIKALFNADDPPFVTSPSDTGWEISTEEDDL